MWKEKIKKLWIGKAVVALMFQISKFFLMIKRNFHVIYFSASQNGKIYWCLLLQQLLNLNELFKEKNYLKKGFDWITIFCRNLKDILGPNDNEKSAHVCNEKKKLFL